MPSNPADETQIMPRLEAVKPTPPAPDSTARQLRQFKILALVLLVALVAGGGYALYLRHAGQPVTILLDGQAITNVRNAATANTLLAQAEQAKIGAAFPEDSVVRLQKVEMQRLPSDARLDPDKVAQAKLRNALKLHVHAYVIFVNGRVSLGLPTDDMAADALHQVKEHFAQMPPSADLVEEPSFVERVAIKPRAVDASQTRPTAEAAAPYFWTPPPSKTYTVRRGDTGLVIARRNHISLSDFITANAARNINRLTPGDTVNVQKMPLLLTVRVQKKFTREEKILANVPAAEAGLRQVTYAVTYLNGQETHRDVLEMTTIQTPQARTSL